MNFYFTLDLYTGSSNGGLLTGILDELQLQIPRLRGLSLMKYDQPLTKEKELEYIRLLEASTVRELLEDSPRWKLRPNPCELDAYWVSWKVYNKYLKITDSHAEYVKWENLHGKKKNQAKYWIKKNKKAYYAQYDLYNKYAGRPDVLCVSSRIGSTWEESGGREIENHPAFLGEAVSWFDPTFCEIYLKFDPENPEIKKLIMEFEKKMLE